MIHSAYKLLKILKSLVETDKDEIWIDYEKERFERVHISTLPDVGCPFPTNEPSVEGLLTYLNENGYITIEKEEYCKLTYKALYYKQLARSEMLHYLLRSVFVPIILSVVTSILTTTFLPELLSALLQKIQ